MDRIAKETDTINVSGRLYSDALGGAPAKAATSAYNFATMSKFDRCHEKIKRFSR